MVENSVPSKDNLDANDLYRFIIAGDRSSGINVSGQMQNQLSIGGENSYTDVGAIIGEVGGIVSSISKTLGAVVSAATALKRGLDAANTIASQSKVTDVESRLIWEGSSKPQFVIEYTFYNESQTQAKSPKGALSMALALQKAVLPSKGSPAKGRAGVFFKSPLGYKPKTGGNKVASGTLTLSIGKWFRASDLVIRSTNFTPSIQVLGNGHPVLVKGSVTLEPSELITYETFKGYFRDTANSAGSASSTLLGKL